MGTTGQERQEWLRFEISSGWLGKVTGFLDVPRHAPCFHRRKKKTMYALAGDRVACRWVRRFVGELVRACEDLRRPGLPPKLRTDRADEKRWSTFWKSYRRSGLTKALRDEGFNVSVLRPIIERLLDAIDAADERLESRESILRQLPGVFTKLRLESKRNCRRAYAPIGSKCLSVPVPILNEYLRLIPSAISEQMRLSGIKPERVGRPARLPLAPGQKHADAARSLRTSPKLILQLRDVLKREGAGPARFGWLVDLTRIWPYHRFRRRRSGSTRQTGPTVEPGGYFPTTCPHEFQPCRACRGRSKAVRSCRRSHGHH